MHRLEVIGDEGVEGLLRETRLFVDRRGERRDLGLAQSPHGLAEHVVLFGRTVQVEFGRTCQGDSRSKDANYR